jgi:hypothetical protein
LKRSGLHTLLVLVSIAIW